jgi:cysteine desulfurase
MLYLDHAATSPVRPEVLEAMLPILAGGTANPSSTHSAGTDAAAVLADARSRIAAVLGMRAGDIVFTAGGTEADNLAIKGIAVTAALRRGSPGAVVTTPIEHEAVLASCEHLRRVHGFRVTMLPVDGGGRVDPSDLAAAIDDDTDLVTIGYANNEVGTVQDAAALAAVTSARRVPLHLDAVQAVGWLPLAGAGADALSIAGHKIGAAPGTGVLAVRGRIPLEPLLHGGGQERGRRAGTENVAGAVGLAVALELAEAERVEAAARVGAVRDALVADVLAAVPQARLTGDPVRRLPGTASFTFAGTSGEAVLLQLERRGILTSSGSACAAGRTDPSHVLLALGVDPAVASTSVRITLGRGDLPDPHALARAVADAVAAVASGG